ncbi:hypothetical protein FIBSPDRAFT_890437 [Athelia psychrophila]|uniref:Beta-lactamase-related domain-containing protein n=1 Tax=Athelia psychrophila TaxID=1759441 RepID=A0A166KW87_9AGAM|nr:hypothetical protein FIBSPDRAFT_890437 [Fibularhizoctonia sp. CBS 109695]
MALTKPICEWDRRGDVWLGQKRVGRDRRRRFMLPFHSVASLEHRQTSSSSPMISYHHPHLSGYDVPEDMRLTGEAHRDSKDDVPKGCGGVWIWRASDGASWATSGRMDTRSRRRGGCDRVMAHIDGLGGGGVYGSPVEYLRVLGSLLRDDGKLLQSASVDELFRPQLSKAIPAGNIPVGTDASWGLGGMTTLEDVDGRRRKGSVAWGGLPNLFWWMDRETGVVGVYASQIVPPRDAQSKELFEAFERHVYKMVDGSQ